MLKDKFKISFLIGLILLGGLIVTSKTIAFDEEEYLMGGHPPPNYAPPNLPLPPPLDDVPLQIPAVPNPLLLPPAVPLQIPAVPNLPLPPPAVPLQIPGGNLVEMRRNIDNILNTKRETIYSMHKKIRSMHSWELRKPIIKYSSMFVDLIGGTAIAGIAILGSDLFELNESFSSLKIAGDLIQIGFAASIVALKVADFCVDYKIKNCRESENEFDENKEASINLIMAELNQEYRPIDIKTAAHAYLTINEKNVPYWIQTGRSYRDIDIEEKECTLYGMFKNCCFRTKIRAANVVN